MVKPSIVALIPARAGSKRIYRKNMRVLAHNPLIWYTIQAAKASGVFYDIACSTDDTETGYFASACGVRYLARPVEFATDDTPDIEWVRYALQSYHDADAFAILRPTSPFRTAETIQRAYRQFTASACSSLRAVETVTQHPGKMWQQQDSHIVPLINDWIFPNGVPMTFGNTPAHSRPTQTLPSTFVQNASLEMAWTWCVTVFDSISGPKVAPFFTGGYEGFDLNTEADWREAERLIASGEATLPTIAVAGVSPALTEK